LRISAACSRGLRTAAAAARADIPASVLDGLLLGAGNAVIGVAPATRSGAKMARKRVLLSVVPETTATPSVRQPRRHPGRRALTAPTQSGT